MREPPTIAGAREREEPPRIAGAAGERRAGERESRLREREPLRIGRVAPRSREVHGGSGPGRAGPAPPTACVGMIVTE